MKAFDYIMLMFLLLVGIFLFILSYPRKTAAENSYYIDLQISNPYGIGLNLETKCDWQSDRGKYKYYRKIYIPRKTITTLTFPNHLKSCELWPKIDW